MALILTTTVSWIVFVAVLNSARWQFTNPVTQALAVAGVLLVARPTVLAVELDTPFPDDEWIWRDIDAVLVRTQWAGMLFLVAVAVTARLARSTPTVDAPRQRPAGSAGRRRRGSWYLPTDERLARWIPVLVAVSLLVTVPYWVRYGGFQGLTRASKGQELAGTARVLRVPAIAAAYLGMALAMSRDGETHRWRYRGLLAYAVGAFLSYSWGARDAVIFPLVLPIVAMASRPTRLSVAAVRRAVRKTPAVLVVASLVLGGGFALRVLRDVTITGNVQSSIAGQTIVRRVSVAMNQTQFDTFMLVVADTPEPMPRGGAEAVGAAARSLLPGVVRPDGAALTPPALTVATFYEPTRRNGWPMTVAGDWYWALGWAGVALGGIITGLVFTRLDAWRRRQPITRAAATNAYVLLSTTTVALGGVSLTSPARALNIGLPILVVGAALAVVPSLGKARVERFTVPDERDVLERTRDWTLDTIGTIERAPRLEDVVVERPLPPPRPDAAIAAADPTGGRRVRPDLTVTLGANVFGVLTGLAIAVMATRVLGQTEFGRLSWAMTATYVGGSVATLGLGLAVVALGPRHSDPRDLRRFIGTSFNVTLVAALALAVLLSAGAVVAPGLVGDDFVDVAKLCGFMIVPTALLTVASAAFRVKGRFAEAAATSEQVTRASVLLALFLATASGNKNANYVIAMAALYLTVGALMPYIALRVSPTTPLIAPVRDFVRDLVPFFLASVGATMIPQIGVITLGLSNDADEVAVLAAAVRVQMLCSLLAGATGRVIGPRIAQHRGPLTDLTPFLRNASTFVFWTTAVIAAPFILGGRWIIPLVFGDGFRDAWVPTVVLLLGLFVNVATGSSGQLLFNTGHERALSRRVLAGGLSFIPLSAVSGWLAGPLGVAVAATALVTALNVWQAQAALRWTGVRTWTHLAPRQVLAAAREMARGRN